MNEKILTAHTIYLRLPKDEDVLQNDWHMWYNDYETTKYNSHGVFPITREQEMSVVQRAVNSNNTILFAICTKYENELIGNCTINKIDLVNRKAEIALTIGHPEYRSRTCGIEAIGLLLEHGFCRLNLNRIYGGADSRLARWIHMMESLGFKKEGTLREDIVRDGNYVDVVRFGILAREYFEIRNSRDGNILFENLSLLIKDIQYGFSGKK
jgi:RimJ/RimL family protein N-acetyltransferase